MLSIILHTLRHTDKPELKRNEQRDQATPDHNS